MKFKILDIPQINIAPGDSYYQFIEIKKPFRLYDWVLRSYAGESSSIEDLTISIFSEFSNLSLTKNLDTQEEDISAELLWKDLAYRIPLGLNSLMKRPVYLQKGIHLIFTNNHKANTYTIDFSMIGDEIDDDQFENIEPNWFELVLPDVANTRETTFFKVPDNQKFEILQLFIAAVVRPLDQYYFNILDNERNQRLFEYDQNVLNHCFSLMPPLNDFNYWDILEMEPGTLINFEFFKHTANETGRRFLMYGRSILL